MKPNKDYDDEVCSDCEDLLKEPNMTQSILDEKHTDCHGWFHCGDECCGGCIHCGY